MRRTLEIIFRHPTRLAVLLLIPPLLGIGVALLLPRTYQATATLWANQRYADIGASGVETNLDATLADTQATALNELLQVRSFALKVSSHTSLASALPPDVRADPEKRDDALYNEISQRVDVTPQASNLYTISYANKNPQLAQQVVRAVIDTFGTTSQSLTTDEGQQLLNEYQAQLMQAQAAAHTAVTLETQFIASHPGLTPTTLLSDPQYAQLHAASTQALGMVNDIQNKMFTLQQQIITEGNSTNLFKVLDDPNVPARPVSRLKQLLLAGGAGAGVALLLSALYVAVLVRRNRTVYCVADLQRTTALHETLAVPVLSHKALVIVTELGPLDVSR
jgi:uncharacterized protein involved in exopolysaccharide biosynthesis